MCDVVCVKISEVEHGFAVRMHKPLAFEKGANPADCSPCSRWFVFSGATPSMVAGFVSRGEVLGTDVGVTSELF